MLVLFDNSTPRTLAFYLIGHHTVTEARARGWEELENGDLLAKAEAAGPVDQHTERDGVFIGRLKFDVLNYSFSGEFLTNYSKVSSSELARSTRRAQRFTCSAAASRTRSMDDAGKGPNISVRRSIS